MGKHAGSGLRVISGVLCLLALLAASPDDLPGPGNTPVADAAMLGDSETVRTLLRQGVDVNAAQGDGMTALHWTALGGNVELAEMLLYAGANVKATTRLGAYTPLLLASRGGHASMAATLLSAGADPGATTTSGTTPLMLAAASGSTDTVAALLGHGAEVNATDVHKGRTALMFAAANNRRDVIEVLTARGADVTLATEVLDVAALDETYSEAVRDREKKRVAAAKAAAEALAAQGKTEEIGPAAAESNEDEPIATGGGRNVFAKLFAWVPGIGGEKRAEEGARRRFRDPFGELVGKHGGLTPLHLAARDGHLEAVESLLAAGADINRLSEGDHTSALLIATINGHFDLGKYLVGKGADPNLASDAGATPLYAAINVQWAPKALYPQPRAQTQQQLSYLDFMKLLLEKGAEPNVRLKKKLWYSSYNFDLTGVDETGATPFWRAAYGTDVEAMRLLVSHGADPNIPTVAPEGPSFGDVGPDGNETKDQSGLPPVPVGGPSVTPFLAASGVGYGKGFAANAHRYHPGGFSSAVQYLVEELGADVNARDHEGYNALHHAASRGDTEMIRYLVDKGCDVTAVSRRGQTTADMANGPVQRIQPFPDAVALLESLGSENHHNCVSC